MHSKVFVYRNCRKQTEWGLCRLTSQITPLSDISYKQIGSPPPLKQLLRVSILLPQCKSVLSSNCFICVVLRKNSNPLKGNVKGQFWAQNLYHGHPILKGILHQKIFYRLNLIFWIVMGRGIARFSRGGLKTTET